VKRDDEGSLAQETVLVKRASLNLISIIARPQRDWAECRAMRARSGLGARARGPGGPTGGGVGTDCRRRCSPEVRVEIGRMPSEAAGNGRRI